jgi:TRAP-type C4-dicarboxylate transport system substrate-binding protein
VFPSLQYRGSTLVRPLPDLHDAEDQAQWEDIMNQRSKLRWAAVTVGALLLAACGSEGGETSDKTGSDTVVLKLATIDEVNDNGQSYGPQAFVDELAKVSSGRLRVDVTKQYGDGAPDAEVRLVRAIADGTIDGGWPATRAFANAGIKGLQAVEAPLTLTSYDAEKALVTSPVAGEMLAHLEGSGVVGLGLTVGPLRRPFAGGEPLLAPADWRGASFRIFNSPVQGAAVSALGGTPVQLGFDWPDEVAAGALRGAEFDVAQYAQNGRTNEAGLVTANVVLWPKVFVLSLSQKRYDSLTDEQKEWVRTAAERATQASVDATYDETSIARKLCDSGARFIKASNEQVAAMKSAVAPVITQLASDPVEGSVLKKIQELAADHGDAETPDVPDNCASLTPDDAPATVPATSPAELSALPDGVYRVEISLDDVISAGLTNNKGWTGTWTLTVAAETYQVHCAPLDDPGRDCGNIPSEAVVEGGRLVGAGNTVTFESDRGEAPYTLTWAIDGDKLNFTDPETATHFVIWNWLLEPLTKIG